MYTTVVLERLDVSESEAAMEASALRDVRGERRKVGGMRSRLSVSCGFAMGV